MSELPINLIKGDTVGSETDYRDSLPVNMYAVARPVLGAQGYMIQAQGLTQYGDSSGISYGSVYNDRFTDLYRVQGSDFISVDSVGGAVVLGAVSGTDTASLAYSFNTQSIVKDGKFYLYDAANGFRQIVDSDLGDPIDCVWVDGYYFFTDGEFIYHTNIADESEIDPLKFATAEFMPDKSLGLDKTQDNKVMVFGRYTIEYFVNTASDNFAFQRVQTRAQKIGIVGTHCKAEVGQKHYILGGRKEECVSVHIITVGGSQRVSTREVDKVIGQYSEPQLSTSVVESFKEDGVTFVVIHLPNECLVFNETVAESVGYQDAWSIYKTDTTGDLPWRAKHLTFDARRGDWVCGDKRDGKLGVIDATVGTHYDAITEWLLDTPFTNIETASIDKLELEIVPGYTTTTDGTVFVSMTYDGVYYGKEWTADYGLPGDYGKRLIVRRLGYVRDWFAFRLRGATRSRMAFALARIDFG